MDAKQRAEKIFNLALSMRLSDDGTIQLIAADIETACAEAITQAILENSKAWTATMHDAVKKARREALKEAAWEVWHWQKATGKSELVARFRALSNQEPKTSGEKGPT